MHNTKRKIAVFFIGLLTAVFLLEVGLRIIGATYRIIRSSGNKAPVSYRESSRIILCLGNSWTEGGGAPSGKSYPDDLQRLINVKFGNGKITVINGGFGNENTAELLDKLETKIDSIKPGLVILQTGQPNLWNYHKYSNYLKREHLKPAKPIFSANDFFHNSRVYRLLCLLANNLKNKNNIQVRNYEVREQVCSEFAGELQKLNKDIVVDKEKVSEAVSCFKKGITLYPDDSRNYDCIGLIYFLEGSYEEALKWFIKAVESNLDLEVKGGNKGYEHIRLLRGEFKGAKNNEINKKIENFIQKVEKNRPGDSENLLFLTEKEMSCWLKSDIKEIAGILQKDNIKIILQNYPFDPYVGARFIDSILRKVANDLNIPFVDNELIFLEMMNKGAKRDDCFSPDYHCNARGYEIMANNVYNKIIEEKILGSEGILNE